MQTACCCVDIAVLDYLKLLNVFLQHLMLSQRRLHTVCCLCVCRDLAGRACVQGSGCVLVRRHLVGDVYWQACVRGHSSGFAGAPDHQGKRVITLGHVNGARVRQIFTEHYTHPEPYRISNPLWCAHTCLCSCVARAASRAHTCAVHKCWVSRGGWCFHCRVACQQLCQQRQQQAAIGHHETVRYACVQSGHAAQAVFLLPMYSY